MGFSGFLTNDGRVLIANTITSEKIIIDKMVIGDSSIPPTPASNMLNNEIYRTNTTSVTINDNIIEIVANIDVSVLDLSGNGFTLREIGILAHRESVPGDVMIAAAEFPESYKPDYIAEGASKSFVIKFNILILNGDSSKIQVLINPNANFITFNDLENYYTKEEVDIIKSELANSISDVSLQTYTKLEIDSILNNYIKKSEITSYIDNNMIKEILDNEYTIKIPQVNGIGVGDYIKLKTTSTGDISIVKQNNLFDNIKDLFENENAVITDSHDIYFTDDGKYMLIAYVDLVSLTFIVRLYDIKNNTIDPNYSYRQPISIVKREFSFTDTSAPNNIQQFQALSIRNVKILKYDNGFIVFYDFIPQYLDDVKGRTYDNILKVINLSNIDYNTPSNSIGLLKHKTLLTTAVNYTNNDYYNDKKFTGLRKYTINTDNDDPIIVVSTEEHRTNYNDDVNSKNYYNNHTSFTVMYIDNTNDIVITDQEQVLNTDILPISDLLYVGNNKYAAITTTHGDISNVSDIEYRRIFHNTNINNKTLSDLSNKIVIFSIDSVSKTLNVNSYDDIGGLFDTTTSNYSTKLYQLTDTYFLSSYVKVKYGMLLGEYKTSVALNILASDPVDGLRVVGSSTIINYPDDRFILNTKNELNVSENFETDNVVITNNISSCEYNQPNGDIIRHFNWDIMRHGYMLSMVADNTSYDTEYHNSIKLFSNGEIPTSLTNAGVFISGVHIDLFIYHGNNDPHIIEVDLSSIDADLDHVADKITADVYNKTGCADPSIDNNDFKAIYINNNDENILEISYANPRIYHHSSNTSYNTAMSLCVICDNNDNNNLGNYIFNKDYHNYYISENVYLSDCDSGAVTYIDGAQLYLIVPFNPDIRLYTNYNDNPTATNTYLMTFNIYDTLNPSTIMYHGAIRKYDVPIIPGLTIDNILLPIKYNASYTYRYKHNTLPVRNMSNLIDFNLPLCPYLKADLRRYGYITDLVDIQWSLYKFKHSITDGGFDMFNYTSEYNTNYHSDFDTFNSSAKNMNRIGFINFSNYNRTGNDNYSDLYIYMKHNDPSVSLNSILLLNIKHDGTNFKITDNDFMIIDDKRNCVISEQLNAVPLIPEDMIEGYLEQIDSSNLQVTTHSMFYKEIDINLIKGFGVYKTWANLAGEMMVYSKGMSKAMTTIPYDRSENTECNIPWLDGELYTSLFYNTVDFDPEHNIGLVDHVEGTDFVIRLKSKKIHLDNSRYDSWSPNTIYYMDNNGRNGSSTLYYTKDKTDIVNTSRLLSLIDEGEFIEIPPLFNKVKAYRNEIFSQTPIMLTDIR